MFSICDGFSGYYRIMIAEEDQKKTALNSRQRHAVSKRALRYVLIGEHLFHKGVDGVMGRVLYYDEIFDYLKACHEEGDVVVGILG